MLTSSIPLIGSITQETLNAASEYFTSEDMDGPSQHHVNQYTLQEEIGRGSYGAVHLAVDQFGQEYVSGPRS